MTTITMPLSELDKTCLAEVQEGHRKLARELNNARGLCASGDWATDSVHVLAEAFSGLRDRLAMQFALENAFCHLDVAFADAAHLVREAAALRDEHSELYEMIANIADEAEALVYRPATPREVRRLIDRFDHLDARLIAHEAREIAVLLAAYSDDIGGSE